MRSVSAAGARSGDRALVIGALLGLSAIGAELLAAYNDTTGRPGALLFNAAFFALLYGCPALLIRELARRTARGWPTMLLLAAAAGLLQAGVIDQSLFTDSYGEVQGWEQTLRATYIGPLGIGAYMAQSFVLGHVVYSLGAPIALAEAMRPALAHRPWLRRRGIVIATALWLLVAGAIFADALTTEDHATPTELGATLVVVAALVVLALRVGRGEHPTRNEPRGCARRSPEASSRRRCSQSHRRPGSASPSPRSSQRRAAGCSREPRAVATGAWPTSPPSPPARC